MALAGKAAFFMFLYLEVLDASFSFDGVIGAFAITNDIVLMALGLGIGAMYVRSLTVYLVRQGTLDDYVYLEHGAHYAIGALAVILLDHHPVRDQRDHHRPHRCRPDRLVLLVLGPPQPRHWRPPREKLTPRATRQRSRPGCDTPPVEERSEAGRPTRKSSRAAPSCVSVVLVACSPR